MKETRIKIAALYVGPVIALLVGLSLQFTGWDTPACITGGITVLCAIWWIFEPIPVPVTSIIPLGLFPLLDVLSAKEVSAAYGNPLILLLLGGFILSTAMAKSGAHRRIALSMVHLCGAASGRRLVFGFMLAAAVLSMWISNTATTLMLLPVALAVLESAEDKRLTVPLLLGIAYAASLGGMGTPIGTPPNVIFMEIYTEFTGNQLSFIDWMKWGVPVVILFLPVMAFWLTRSVTSRQRLNIPSVGTWRIEERRVLIVFALTALAWVTRKEPFGGWSGLFDLQYANDAAVALTAVVVMFLVPNGKGGRLLDWQTANSIPWGVLLLFGGGISIAKAFIATGLSDAMGAQLSGLIGLSAILLLLIICLCVTFLTEITSNTATTTLLMPILAAAGLAANIDPALLMVPAAMSASCAFMLPVATAPNAIVYGSERVSVKIMAQEGIVLNLIGATIITLVCYLSFAGK